MFFDIGIIKDRKEIINGIVLKKKIVYIIRKNYEV